MIRAAPLLQILHHSSSRLLVNRNVVTSHAINILPTFPASRLQRELDVGEGLCDFGGEAGGDGDGGCVGVPTAWSGWLGVGLMDCWLEGMGWDGMGHVTNLGRRF
jgi:hypothetical protein